MMNLKDSYEADFDATGEEAIKDDTLQKMAAFESIRQELSSTEFK